MYIGIADDPVSATECSKHVGMFLLYKVSR